MDNINIKQLNFIVSVAAYLYSLTNDYEGKNQEWHQGYFISMYNNYNNSEHDGDCTNKPWSCDRCFVEKYLHLAESIINVDKLNDYLKELEE